MERGTFQLMKSVNKSVVLNKIRLAEPISRAQIAKETGITPPTVSTIVKELINENLVEESILGESKGGRKPTMLLLKRNGHHVIGIDA
ncbi:helix-turn-helix domain-containing protein, partial [Carnobacterium sp.]